MPVVRTGYSFRIAVGHLGDVIERLSAIGAKSAPIADRMSTFGFNRWSKACKKAGLKPIYGVELAVTLQLGDQMPTVDYWQFLAKDDIAALHELIFTATGQTSREPMVLLRDALAAPGLIKIAGERCPIDEMPVDDPDLYIGLSPATPRGLVYRANEWGHKFVAANANYYPKEADKEFYRVALSGNFQTGTQTYPMHILSEAEWNAATDYAADFIAREEAWANWEVIEARCNAQLKKATLLVAEKPKSLMEMCRDAAPALGIDLADPVYNERLERELRLIDEKQFEDYFYIITDMIQWAKQHMVCGPARGSSCGSLVCYLLGITAIDPIKYDLLFERFIDTTRSDLPDIDLDFSDVNRHKVFEYMEEKYGKERVARLGTVGMFQPRSAINRAGMALRIPAWKLVKVTDNIIERSSGDSRALQQLEDTLKDTDSGRKLLEEYPEIAIAGRMEGHPNVASQHAAGLLVTQGNVREFVAIDARTKAAMCDKKDAEDLNLLKIDALGLTQLSIFERTLELIGEKPISGWLEKIPLDDPLAFGVLNRRRFSGIFQFMGGALKSLSNQIEFTSVNDLIAITALARPGPMATGGANTWVKRKVGVEKVTYTHAMLEPYLKETLGIIVYQEQVMQICREIGELSWGDVNALRRAMSKSLGEEFFDQYGSKWKANAVKRGIPEEAVNTIWKDLCAFGSMGFNKAHAVAYGTVSYWCCWLKAHHPLEFAAATLDAESDPLRQISFLREMEKENVGYVAIDPERSTDKWVPDHANRRLVGPLTNVKGIGPATVREILEFREPVPPGTPKKPLKAGTQKKLANAKTPIDTLYPVRDRVAFLHPNIEVSANIHTTATKIVDVQPGLDYHPLIIGIAHRIVPRDENEAVNIAKREAQGRQGKLDGDTRYLNLFFLDDTDEIFVRIDRADFEKMGLPVLERGRAGKAIYAVKGSVPMGFRMIKTNNIRYLGDMELDEETVKVLPGDYDE